MAQRDLATGLESRTLVVRAQLRVVGVAIQPHVLTPGGLGGALGPAQQRQPDALASVVAVRRQPVDVDRIPRRLPPGLDILPLKCDFAGALASPARNPCLAAHD